MEPVEWKASNNAENLRRDHLGEAERLVENQKRINNFIRVVEEDTPVSSSPPVGIYKDRRLALTKDFIKEMTLLENEYAEGFRARNREAAEAVGETVGPRKDCHNPYSLGCEGGVFQNAAGEKRGCERYDTLPLWRSLCPLQKTGWSSTVRQAGIPLKYQDATIKSLNPEWYPEHLRPSMRLVEGYVSYLDEHIRKGQGLVLAGNHKTMRTSMAVSILMEAIAKEKSGFFIASSSLVDKLFLPRTSNRKDREELKNFVNRLKQTDLLVWDDLGLEHSEDWVETKVVSIISERYNNAKPTIFTTGLDLDEVPRNSIAYHVMEVTREVNDVIGFEVARPPSKKPPPLKDKYAHHEDMAPLPNNYTRLAKIKAEEERKRVLRESEGHLVGDMDSNGRTGSIDPRGVDCDHKWALVVGLGEGPGWSYCKKCNVHRHVPQDDPQEKKGDCEHNWVSWHLSQYCPKCFKTRPFPQPIEQQEYIEADQARLKRALEENRDKEAPGYQCEKEESPRGEKVKPKHDWFESPDENKEICTQCGKTRALPLSAWTRSVKIDLCDIAGRYPKVEGWTDES